MSPIFGTGTRRESSVGRLLVDRLENASLLRPVEPAITQPRREGREGRRPWWNVN